MIDVFLDRLRDTWAMSDRVFNLVPRDRWLEQPIKLRHPVLFYVGHLPAFAWNQIGGGLMEQGALHPVFDDLFERGIDPVGVDRHDASVSWPSIDEVVAYRDHVRERLLDLVEPVLQRAGEDPMADRGRILNVVLEHEWMHHETLQYMFLELPSGSLRRPDDLRPHRFDGRPGDDVVEVGPGSATLGADFESIEFGWDNEFPTLQVEVAGFRIDRMPVTIGAWLDFVEAGGYATPEYWKTADWEWRSRVGLDCPPRWRRSDGGWRYRTLFDDLDLGDVRHWPVMVSLAEARAWCAWKGDRRLPSEAELQRALYGDDGRRFPWGDDAPEAGRHGNFGFHRWSPTPVDAHPDGASPWGLVDGIGNAWEWTETVFAGFPGFTAYIPSYPGYSADFFDGRHFVMHGASWATPTPLIRRSFRNWFQDHYPYAFAGFRTIRTG
jgi:ergothioneine biosynthesis protein EgtB